MPIAGWENHLHLVIETPEANLVAGRAEVERRMEVRWRREMDNVECEFLRRGWCLGSESFRKEVLGRAQGQLRESHAGE